MIKKIALLLFVTIFTFGCLSSTGTPAANGDEPVEVPEQEETIPTAEPVEATDEPTEEPTEAPTPTDEPTPTPEPSPAEMVLERIAEYNNPELEELVNEYSNAELYTLDDETVEGAHTTSLFRFPYEISPEEFLAIADVSYEHATSNIRKSSAGCGYLFYDNDDDQRYYTLFTLDNEVRLTQVRGSYWDGIFHKKYNSLALESPSGEVQIMLMLLHGRAIFVVDGEIVIDKSVDWQSKGFFGYALLSGTASEYGTRCSYTDSLLLVNE